MIWAQNRTTSTECPGATVRRRAAGPADVCRRTTAPCLHRHRIERRLGKARIGLGEAVGRLRQAAAGKGPRTKCPRKPLVAPSGRIQLDVANFTQNPASVTQFGNAQNTVGFRRARLALLGEYEQSTTSSKWTSPTVAATPPCQHPTRTSPRPSRTCTYRFTICPCSATSASATSRNVSGWNSSPATTTPRSWSDRLRRRTRSFPAATTASWRTTGPNTNGPHGRSASFTNQTGYDQPPTFTYDHWGLDCTMRATYLPWYDEASGGRGLLHTGLDYAYRSAPTIIGLRRSPRVGFAPSVVNMTVSTDPSRPARPDRCERLAGRRRRSGVGLRAAFRADRGLRHDAQPPRRRQQQLLRRLRLRELLPHRREPAVQPEDWAYSIA